MTFLNPLVLFALAAAALPLIYHLLNKRRLRTVEFSTLAFLKRLEKTRIRRVKLRQWILLLVRTLAIVCIVLAFARPALHGTLPAGFGAHAATTAVILFDDSPSMTRSNVGGTFFAQAKDAALQALSMLQEGDEVHLIPISKLPAEKDAGTTDLRTLFPARRNLSAVRSDVSSATPSAIHRQLETALRAASALLAESKNFNKEVYLFTDFQAGIISRNEQPHQPERLFTPDVRFFATSFEANEAMSIGIRSATIENSIFEAGAPVALRAELINSGTGTATNVSVSLYLDGIRSAQTAVSIPSGGMTAVAMNVVPSRSGFHRLMIETEDDDTPFDNTYWLSFYVPAKIRILLSGADEDIRFLRAALRTRAQTDSSGFEITENDRANISSAQLSKTDVVLLAGGEYLSSAAVEAIASFVTNGGGLIYFPSSAFDVSTFAERLGNQLGISPGASTDSASGGVLSFRSVEYEHPLFRGLFEQQPPTQTNRATERETIESPKVNRAVRFAPPQNALPVIGLTGGIPFLYELRKGAGKVLTFAVAPVLDWSDFPVKGIFVPLVVRAASYVARQEINGGISLTAGEPFSAPLPRRSIGSVAVIKPGGVEVFIDVAGMGGSRGFVFNDTQLPGIYTVSADGTPFEQFSVHLDQDESLLRTAPESEREQFFGRFGVEPRLVRMAASPRDIAQAIRESRYGTELWSYALAIALILLLIETALAGGFSKQREKSAPTV